MAISGTSVYAIWKKETVFASTVTGAYKSLGTDLKLDSFNTKSNVQKAWGLGNVESTVQFSKQYEGSASFSGLLSDPWIFNILTGNAEVATGTGPYTHAYVDSAGTGGAATAPAATIPSIAIGIGENVASPFEHTIKGAVLKTFSLGLKVDEPVTEKLDFDFATDTDATAYGTNTNPTDVPYTFAMGTFEFPTATGITAAPIQSIDITMNRNPTMRRGLGNNIAQTYTMGKFEHDLKMNIAMNDKSWLEYLHGASGSATPAASSTEQVGLKVILNNGLGTTANRQVQLRFDGAMVNERGTSASVEEMQTEDVTFSVRKLALCQAINATATQP